MALTRMMAVVSMSAGRMWSSSVPVVTVYPRQALPLSPVLKDYLAKDIFYKI